MKAFTIIVNVTVATGLTVIKQLTKGKVAFEPVLAGFIAGTMLLILAIFAADLAVAFSLLLLVTSLLTNASEVIASIEELTA